MIRKLFCTFLGLCYSCLALAQAFQFLPDDFTQRVNSAALITNNPTLTGTDYEDDIPFTTHDRWADMVNILSSSGDPSSSYRFKSIQDYVRVGINHDTGVVVDAYHYEIVLSVKCYNPQANFDINTATPATTKTITLTLTYDPAAMQSYTDLSVQKFSGFHAIKATVIDIKKYDLVNPSAPPVPVQRDELAKNFYVETGVSVQRYDISGFSLFPISSANGDNLNINCRLLSSSLLNCSGFNPSQLVNIKPVQYELEWLYVDDYHVNPATGTISYGFGTGGNIAYDFRKNSTRVRLISPIYNIPLLYEHGAIVFRVRTVRPDILSWYEDLIYSDWTLADQGTIAVDDNCLYTKAYIITTAHSNDKLNWQYTINFAEEGKYKHVINYFDGALKSRQAQTKINTDGDYIVVSDNTYDYEGRPALQTLPVPVQQPGLNYRPDIMINNSTVQPYKAADFDFGCTEPLPPSIPSLHVTAKAHIYYSLLNPDQSGMQKYVPDAEGYPMIQTIYSPDNTNKVLWQGGAGLKHQLWNGHGTRYEYMRATQTEIDRLLGTEAGKYQFYPKQVLTDPNGQSSFSILNLSGKVVATGLLGDVNTTEQPIDHLDNFPEGVTQCSDMMVNLSQEKLVDKLVAENSFYVDGNGSATTLSYEVGLAHFYTQCSGKYLKAAAIYNIKVTDECGNTYMNTSYPLPGAAISGTVGTYGIHTLLIGQSLPPITAGPVNRSATLNKGKYTIHKELSFSMPEIKEQVGAFIKSSNNALCYRDSNYFIRNAVEAATFPCISENEGNSCEIRRAQMISELYPGAKYGKYNKGADERFGSGMPNSIFTLYTELESSVPGTSSITQTNGNTTTTTVTTVVHITLPGGTGQCQVPTTGCTTQTCGGNTACGCPSGAHSYLSPCCSECLQNYCACINYPYSVTTRTTTGTYSVQVPVTQQVTHCTPKGSITARWDYRTVFGITLPIPAGVIYEQYCNCDKIHSVTVSMYNGLTPGVPLPFGTSIPFGGHNCLLTNGYTAQTTPLETVVTRDTVSLLEELNYRYQSPCLRLPASVTHKGITYTNLASLSPQQFIDIFNEEIAEALLPLHPEYCKLLLCNDGNFEQMLESRGNWRDAEAYGMFLLEDIIHNDPIYLADPTTAQYNKLAYFKGQAMGKTLDKFALEMAYCAAGNQAEQEICRALNYADEIDNFIFINEQVKQQYYELLKTLYLGNRGYLKQQAMDASGTACGPCADRRMTLTGDPVFPVLFDANGTAVGDGTEDMPQWVLDAYNEASGPNAGSMTTPDELTDLVEDTRSEQISAIVRNVNSSLANCSMSFMQRLDFTAGLSNALSNNGGLLTPELLQYVLVNPPVSIALSDLCHPFLAKYGLYEPPPDRVSAFNCGNPEMYAGMKDFFSRSGVINVLKNSGLLGGSSASFTLSASSNTFEAQIEEYYNQLQGGSGPLDVTVKATVNTITAQPNSVPFSYYKLEVVPSTPGGLNSAHFLHFYIKGRSAAVGGGSGSSALDDASGISINNVLCLNDDAYALNTGLIAERTAILTADVTTLAGTTVDSYFVWSNMFNIMTATDGNTLDKCVTCVDIQRAMSDFHSDQAAYAYDVAYNHPLYRASLCNYLNYKLKKRYSFEDYDRLMRGCALSDKQYIKRYRSTVEISGSNSDINDFISNLQAIAYDRTFVSYRIAEGSTHKLYLDLNSLQSDSVKWYLDKVSSAAGTAGVSQTYLPYNAETQVFARNDQGGGSASSLSAVLLGDFCTVTSQQQVTVYENGSPVNYTRYSCDMGSTELAKSNAMEQLEALAADHSSFIHYDAQLLRSADYHSAAKQAYLDYIYGLPSGATHEAVCDAIAEAPLQTHISQFAGRTLSYRDPYCAAVMTDLYAFPPGNGTHPGMVILQDVLARAGVVSLNGQTRTRHLFPSGDFGYYYPIPRPNPLPPISDVAISRKADGTYWYRYFDGNNRMYNIYIMPPADVAGIHNFQLVGQPYATAGNGDNVRNFTVTVSDGTHTLECPGYTDFSIGSGAIKVKDVVLYRNEENNRCFDSLDCERELLMAAVYNGQAAYRHYFDSLRDDMSKRMITYLLDNVQEKMEVCTQSRKYQFTLYYYDKAGNLCRTVPPAGVQPLNDIQLDQVDAARNNNSYQPITDHRKESYYYYNTLNQLYRQETPDGGITYFFYDAAGRLVFSQNSRQRPQGYYSYTLYDKLSRITETGEVRLGCTLPDNPNVLFDETPCSFTMPPPYSGTITSVHPPYVDNARTYSSSQLNEYVRTKTRRDVVVTVYDESPVDLSGIADYALSKQENLRKRVAAIYFFPSLSNTFSSANWNMAIQNPYFVTYYSYDMLGNVKTVTYDFKQLSTVQQRYKRIDYDYDQLSGKVNMLSYNRGRPDQFYHLYSYDADNRITEVRTSNDALIWNTDARYSYYKHGPLAAVRVGDSKLQSIEYAYTIQGWLKAMNSDVRRPDLEMGKNGIPGDLYYARDAVAHALDYFTDDYKAIGGNSAPVSNLPAPSQGLYNGNIVRQTTAVQDIGNMQRSYRYDQLQRLKLATNAEIDETALTASSPSPSDIYKSSYSYDPDGNISSLQRWDGTATGSGTQPNLDNFTYAYNPSGTDNKLLSVDEQVPATGGSDLEPGQEPSDNYHYDKTGNLIRDRQGHSNISWNLYGKVKLVKDTESGRVINFGYDGTGNRIWKEVVEKRDRDEEYREGQYYVRDAGGNILSVYLTKSMYSPIKLIHETNVQLQSSLGTSAFHQFLQTEIAPLPGFYAQLEKAALSELPDFVNDLADARNTAFYMQQDEDIYTRMLDGNIRYLPDFRAYAAEKYDTSQNAEDALLGYAVSHSESKKQGSVLKRITHTDPISLVQMMTHFTEQVPEKALPLWPRYELEYNDSADVYTNVLSLLYYYVMNADLNNIWEDILAGIQKANSDYIEDNELEVPEGAKGTYYVAPEVASFYASLTTDTLVMPWFNSTGMDTIWAQVDTTTDNELLNKIDFLQSLSDAISRYADKAKAIAFFEQWPLSDSLMREMTSTEHRFNVAYNYDTEGGLNSFLQVADMELLDEVIAGMPELTAVEYLERVIKSTATPDNFSLITEPVKYDISLSEHHLYGSSRLGIQHYANDKFRNTWNKSGGIIISMLDGLGSKLPWYSYPYGELINPNERDFIWGNGDISEFKRSRTLANKKYELTDHLGNVLATVLDRKTGQIASVPTLYDHYLADVETAQDYYPFGMPMPGRDIGIENYRHGWNTHENVNEIAGPGNHTTAKFGEFDTRIGKRWNVDPKPVEWESPYAVNRNNPLLYNDPDGDFPFMLNPFIATKNTKDFFKGFGMTMIQAAGGFTQIWEHGKGNPNAMSLKDIGIGMVKGVVDPVVNFVRNPNAENLGSLVATGLIFKSFAQELNMTKSIPLETGGKIDLSLNSLNKRMAFEEKASVFDKSGNLKSEIQMKAEVLRDIDMSKTKNQNLIDHLTKDGSTMADWDKMSVNIEIRGADGKINTNMDIHYYQNRQTGRVDMGYDYKAKLGSEYYKKQSAKPKEN